MTLNVADRVLEITSTQGTGVISLAGPTEGFRSFSSSIASGKKVPYIIDDNSDWEIGIGTITHGSPNTLSRDAILSSSNNNAAINWGPGVRNVRCAPLASLVLLRDEKLNSVEGHGVPGGTANAQTLTFALKPLGYSDGMRVRYFATAENTGPATINLNELGAKEIKVRGGNLSGGEIKVGSFVDAVYRADDNVFELLSPVILDEESIDSSKLGGDITLFGKSLLTAADAATQRALIGAVGVNDLKNPPLMSYGGMGFNTSFYLDSNPLTGIADGKVGTFFGVVRFASAAGVAIDNVLCATGDRFFIQRTLSGQLRMQLANVAGTSIFTALTVNPVLAAAGTYTILVSYDLAAGAYKILVNGVDVTPTASPLTNDTIDYTAVEWSVGGSVTGVNPLTGDIYLLYLDSNTYIDLSVTANVRKFISADNTPVYLGPRGNLPSGATPILFLAYDSGRAWASNKGYATSAFTANGTQTAQSVALYGAYKSPNDNVNYGVIGTGATCDIPLPLGYTKHEITLDKVLPVTDAVTMRATFTVDDFANVLSTLYRYAGTGAVNTTNSVTSSGTGTAAYIETGLGSVNLSNVSGEETAFLMEVIPTVRPKLFFRSTAIKADNYYTNVIGSGTNDTTSIVNGIRLSLSSGNFAGGSWTVRSYR